VFLHVPAHLEQRTDGRPPAWIVEKGAKALAGGATMTSSVGPVEVPEWLPAWYLRREEPPHGGQEKAEAGPELTSHSAHQTIAMQLGLHSVLVGAVQLGEMLDPEKATNAKNIKSIVAAAFHCLRAFVSAHEANKRLIVPLMEELVSCVEEHRAAPPTLLVGVWESLFAGEPALQQDVDENLLELACSYVHLATPSFRLAGCDAQKSSDNAANRTRLTGVGIGASGETEAVDAVLRQTLTLLYTLCGGEEGE
jgi:hypothetical protein